MTQGLRIIVPKNFLGWSLGASTLAGGFRANASIWEGVNEQFFAATQDFVHVISGGLKESGSYSVELQGNRVVGLVGYSADYAPFEFGRGGDHDAMSRGWEKTQGLFQEAMGRTWERVVAEWNVI